MSSGQRASSSSADLPPGTLIAGYRVERVLGRGSTATVYEATQLALDRRVALKLLHDPARADAVARLTWPDHPGAVRLYATGDSPYGPWLALQLMTGGTLADRRRVDLDPAADALAAVHASGAVHGTVTARNVLLLDGRAHLSDFGLAAPGATAQDDLAALAALRRAHAAAPRRRLRARLAALAVLVLAATGAAVVVLGREDVPEADPAPPALAGTVPLGSDLAAGPVEAVDCLGLEPSGTSRPCSVSQETLAGRPVVVPFAGRIVAWAVLGARGPVALQVLRGEGGASIAVDRSGDERPGGGPALFRTDLAVAAGDRVALELTPGAAVGVRRRADSTTSRWFSPLREEPLRAPDMGPGTGFDRELLLRVDLRRSGAIAVVRPLRGAAAASAPPGRTIGTTTARDGLRVRVVALGTGVGIDLFDGSRRLSRRGLTGADARGRLLLLQARPDGDAVLVRWRNPDGTRRQRALRVRAAGLG